MMDCLLSHRLEGTGPPLQLGASLENSIVIAAGSSSGTLARSHVEAPHSSLERPRSIARARHRAVGRLFHVCASAKYKF